MKHSATTPGVPPPHFVSNGFLLSQSAHYTFTQTHTHTGMHANARTDNVFSYLQCNTDHMLINGHNQQDPFLSLNLESSVVLPSGGWNDVLMPFLLRSQMNIL